MPGVPGTNADPRGEVGDFMACSAASTSWRRLAAVVSPRNIFGRKEMRFVEDCIGTQGNSAKKVKTTNRNSFIEERLY